MKKKTIFISLLLITSHVCAFIIGSWRGGAIRHAALAVALEEANAHVAIAHYSSYRDIALAIKKKNYKDASCRAEMMATSMFEELDSCKANEHCREGIQRSAQQFAPEIFDASGIQVEKRNSCPSPGK